MADKDQIVDTLRDTLRRASKVADTPRRRAEEAVRKMAENPNVSLMDAPQLAIEFLKKGRAQAERAKGVLDSNVRRRLKGMGLATKEEMDALKRRISELEAAAAAKAHEEPQPTSSPKRPPAAATGSAGRARAATARATSRPARTPRASTPKSTGNGEPE